MSRVPDEADSVSISRRPLGVPLAVPALLACVAAGLFLPGVIGDWCIFPVLGMFPGVALAALLPLERNSLARWTLGLAASPLLAAVSAWALMRAGLSLPVAARVVAVAATACWVLAEWCRAHRDGSGVEIPAGLRFAWGWAIGAAAVIAFVLFVNPYLRVRADAWIHGGIVWEILERGIPPQDPRFAGLTLNYVWFYNYFIALLASLRGGDPFAFMAISNTASMFATMGLAWLIGREVWETPRAAAGTALLMGLGFNAGMWILWPLRLLRALIGKVHGPAEFEHILSSTHWNDATVIYDLSPVSAYMVNFLDKPLHGTAINIAYVFMLVYLWAMVRALCGQRGPALFWGAAAAAGMFFFHGVVGLSVVPVSLAALGLAWLLAGRYAWLPPRGRMVAFALATVAGSLVATPYTIAISRAWPASKSGLHHSYLHVDLMQWVTLLTALAVAAWFARRSVGRIVAERRGAAAMIALYVACMLAFSCVVTLPIGSHAKFVFEVFAGLAVLGGVGFHDELASWRRRFGLAGALLIGAILVATPLLTLRGYLLDHSGTSSPEHPMVSGETALYAWIRNATPPGAVFVDRGFRDVIMVEGRRQLLLGSSLGPELAAFSLDEVLKRRAVMADLYDGADSLDRDVSLLSGLKRPTYVLLRRVDADSSGSPAPHFDARPDLFTRVYQRDGFLVYRVNERGLHSPGKQIGTDDAGDQRRRHHEARASRPDPVGETLDPHRRREDDAPLRREAVAIDEEDGQHDGALRGPDHGR